MMVMLAWVQACYQLAVCVHRTPPDARQTGWFLTREVDLDERFMLLIEGK
jgi:hypothetical protein